MQDERRLFFRALGLVLRFSECKGDKNGRGKTVILFLAELRPSTAPRIRMLKKRIVLKCDGCQVLAF